MPPRRKITQYSEPQQTKTLLDVYQNFTRGIFRMLKINPRFICGFDELTSLFSLISTIATIYITFSYRKSKINDIDSFIYTGYNLAAFGCNYSQNDQIHYFGNKDNIKLGLIASKKQASYSSLLSAAGKHSCQGIGIVIGNYSDLISIYPNIKYIISGDGADVIVGGQESIIKNNNLYASYSAKGKELQLSNFFAQDQYELQINVNSKKMYSEISRILSYRNNFYRVFGIIFQFQIPTSVLFFFIPILCISIALNLNLLHRYLRIIIIKDFIYQVRLIVAVLTFFIFYVLFKVNILLKLNLDMFINTQENLLKSIVLCFITLSGILGRLEQSDFWVQNQAIYSVIFYIISVVFYRQASTFLLLNAFISIFCMFIYDILVEKKVCCRAWTKNASYLLIQLPYVFALIFRQLSYYQSLLSVTKESAFISYVMVTVILLTISIGYIPAILKLTTGPLFLLSATTVASFVFFQASIINCPYNNLKENIYKTPSTSQIPLINNEISVSFYCSDKLQICYADVSNKQAIQFSIKQGEEISFSLFNDRWSCTIPKTPLDNSIQYLDLNCVEVTPVIESKLIFRQTGQFYYCE
ncbi:Transmembrane domain-containing protein [Spironucleus salmonicida]|uniref:Transmembrane domain-containing protein n=1 Tax=Spironucleus salmonicida TaxID=348837 RepID=V6LMZ4_9EUKA|nr:Transmembrane domain-containing protein [Spironucleus salmonicida]|eukprot:EST46062.1 Transmembrane domain-containing protein [Spironucleus salmonicida]